jgi:hypothetical protein
MSMSDPDHEALIERARMCIQSTRNAVVRVLMTALVDALVAERSARLAAERERDFGVEREDDWWNQIVQIVVTRPEWDEEESDGPESLIAWVRDALVEATALNDRALAAEERADQLPEQIAQAIDELQVVGYASSRTALRRAAERARSFAAPVEPPNPYHRDGLHSVARTVPVEPPELFPNDYPETL